MVEPTGHCPYLGLKQNRAIRFASPTPEHRCYVSGEPLDIPVDQAKYCLSQGHIHCPLYMGLSLPTTNDTAAVEASAAAAPSGGLRGWYASLSPRDRAIYAAMLGMLALIIAIYLFAGLRAFFSGNGASVGERPTNLPAPTSTQLVAAVATAAATAPALPTPTELPTSTHAPQPTDIPPTDVLIPPPTSAPTSPPAPTSAPINPPASPVVATDSGQSAGVVSTSAPVASPAEPSATSAPAAPPRPTSAPPTPRPTSTPAAPPLPTSAPQVSANRQPVTLYFADTSGTLYVPVRRVVVVENKRIAEAAVRGLIEGSRNGLTSLVSPDARLLGVTIAADATAFVNFDRSPAGDEFALDSIVLTLTEAEFHGVIQRVQIQVNGRNIGDARARPVVNPINPDGLERNVTVTEFLPLYFLSKDGFHHVRVIRMVEKTKQTATATMRALLEGPIGYEYALRRSIPDGTELRGVNKDGSTIWVDFTQPFADAPDHAAAVHTVVESLTTLPGVSGVRFLVEGASLADQWGPEYGRLFTRPPINPE
jgi:spore germination protein GerM